MTAPNSNESTTTVVYGSTHLMAMLREAGYSVRQSDAVGHSWVYCCNDGPCSDPVEFEMQAWAAAKNHFLFNYPAKNLPAVSFALAHFMASEVAKGAEEGLAYEIAESLRAEADEAGPMALQQLPALKSAILTHALEISLDC